MREGAGVRDDRAYFHARVDGDRIVVDGPHSHVLGWPLEPESGRDREGVYASWHWDGRRLRVRNDRYGFYPLYYFRRDGEICLSPSIVRLVEKGAPTDLDYRALSIFLRFGSFIREDTPFEHIRALPPDCLLEWHRDGFTVSGGPVRTKAANITLDDAVVTYRALFRDAIARRLPPSERFAVPLSGGKDSRHILLELCEQGHRPLFCVTSRYFPPFVTPDVEFASTVAATLGVEHIVIDPGISEFKGELWKHTVGNLGSLEPGWMYGMARLVGERTDAIYDGIGGDMLSSDGMLTRENYNLSRAGRFIEMADYTLDRIGLDKLVVPNVASRMRREEAIHYLAQEIEEHADAPDPVNSFFFWNRTRRMIALAPYSVLGHIPYVFSPFLDHRLFDFLNSLSSTFKIENDFHGEAIKRSYPAYADFPVMQRDYYLGHVSPVTNRRFIKDCAAFVAGNRPCGYLRYRYVIPRLLAGLLTKKYAAGSGWFVRLVTYLYCLEKLATRRH